MRRLYERVTRDLDPTWPERYRELCESVLAVPDWTNSDDAPVELINRLIYEHSNGVASAGQALTAWPTPYRPNVGEYREMLQHLKEGLNDRFPSDRVAECRREFRLITNNRGAPSIFNRIVAAFLPGKVSPVMFEADFYDAYEKLVRGGYINAIGPRVGDDPWHSKNVQLMNQLRDLLPDGEVYGVQCPINDYTRGMFVWGVHNLNMDDWMLIRAALNNG